MFVYVCSVVTNWCNSDRLDVVACACACARLRSRCCCCGYVHVAAVVHGGSVATLVIARLCVSGGTVNNRMFPLGVMRFERHHSTK